MTAFTVALIASSMADGLAALGLLALMTRGGRKLHIWAAISACTLTALIFVLKAPLLLCLGFNMFGFIHAAYLDLVVVLPVLAALILFVEWRGRAASSHVANFNVTGPTRIIAILTLACAPCLGLYATCIEPYRVVLEEPNVQLSGDRAGTARMLIGVLADIQTSSVGQFEHRAIDWLLSLKPDLIVIPGDLVQVSDDSYEAQLPLMRELLAKLHAPAGVYFVSGDCEWRDGGADLIRDLNITHLHNRLVTIQHRDRTVTIGGVELNCHSPAARRVVSEMETRTGNADIRILVSHRPDALLNASPDSRIDLLIAGHTHGGQVRVPFFGPLLTLSAAPRRVCAGGLQHHKGNQIYVSRGLGYEGGQAPRLRFNCPPEITLLKLGEPE